MRRAIGTDNMTRDKYDSIDDGFTGTAVSEGTIIDGGEHIDAGLSDRDGAQLGRNGAAADGWTKRTSLRTRIGGVLGFAIGVLLIAAASVAIAMIPPRLFSALSQVPDVAWIVIAIVFAVIAVIMLYVSFNKENDGANGRRRKRVGE